jgi:hypothetical protein
MGVRQGNSSTEPPLIFNREGNREEQLMGPPYTPACCQILGLKLAKFFGIMSTILSQDEN